MGPLGSQLGLVTWTVTCQVQVRIKPVLRLYSRGAVESHDCGNVLADLTLWITHWKGLEECAQSLPY